MSPVIRRLGASSRAGSFREPKQVTRVRRFRGGALSPSFRNCPQPFTTAPQDAFRAARPRASSHNRANSSPSRNRRKHTARLRREQRINPMIRRRPQTSILAPRTHRRILTYFANFQPNAEKSGGTSDQTKNYIKVSQNPHFGITRLRRSLPLPLTYPSVVLGFFTLAALDGRRDEPM